MAKIYEHKKYGFQVKFTLYFPDGSSKGKYRFRNFRAEAEELLRDVEFLENRSRSNSLSNSEVIQARHNGLVSESEARLITGGKVASLYDMDRVLEAYKITIEVSHTQVAYEKAAGKARLIAEWFKDHPIPTLQEPDVEGYILDRRSGALSYTNNKTGFTKRGAKPKTIKNELDIMRGLIDAAKKLGMVAVNVARAVNIPVKTSTLRRALNLKEIDAVIASAERNKHLLHGQAYEMVHVALFTGFRRAELRTLCWSDINLETRRMLVQSKEIDDEVDFNTKSGEARFKSIPDKLMPVLKAMDQKGRFVFGGDQPYNINVISHAIKTVLIRAGLPDVSLHHCRHTYGSWLLKITGDLKLVQDEMGHLDISTTKLYTHTIGDESDPVRGFDYK